MKYHVPVLLEECIRGLNIEKDGIYVDVTAGGGGHSREIMKRLSPKGKLLAMDQDADSPCASWAEENFIFIPSNFRYLAEWLDYYEIEKVDGILADLGVSSHQLDEAQRGFAHKYDSKLDMRMNREQSKSALDVLRDYPEEELSRIFWRYGECRYARKLARSIVEHRKVQPIVMTSDLNQLVRPFARKRPMAELSKVYQAIRIEVNGELDALEELLKISEQRIRKGGRLVVLSYHSLEDGMVKRFLKRVEEEDPFAQSQRFWKMVSRKRDKKPGDKEIQENPRSRSARLRIAERL